MYSAESGTSQLDVIIIIDSSGSIHWERFGLVLDFVANITNNLDIGAGKTDVGALQFCDDAVELFRLDTYTDKQSVIKAIKQTRYLGGKRNTTSAFQLLVRTFVAQLTLVTSYLNCEPPNR